MFDDWGPSPSSFEDIDDYYQGQAIKRAFDALLIAQEMEERREQERRARHPKTRIANKLIYLGNWLVKYGKRLTEEDINEGA